MSKIYYYLYHFSIFYLVLELILISVLIFEWSTNFQTPFFSFFYFQIFLYSYNTVHLRKKLWQILHFCRRERETLWKRLSRCSQATRWASTCGARPRVRARTSSGHTRVKPCSWRSSRRQTATRCRATCTWCSLERTLVNCADRAHFPERAGGLKWSTFPLTCLLRTKWLICDTPAGASISVHKLLTQLWVHSLEFTLSSLTAHNRSRQ